MGSYFRVCWIQIVLLTLLFINPPQLMAQSHAVNPDGSFSYSVPIKVPEGRRGVSPNLSLVYNSNAGDGLLGVGWQLSGLPVITRVDYGRGINYDGQDTYLGPDGILVRMGDGSYHSEKESWNRYVPHLPGGGNCGDNQQGPCAWTVHTSDGNKLYFGWTPDSRIEAYDQNNAHRGGSVRLWALNRFEDAYGNAYDVSYKESNGLHYPEQITYLNYRIFFSYGSPSYRPLRYNQSARTQNKKAMSAIYVIAGSNIIRRYAIAYEERGPIRRWYIKDIREHGSSNSARLPKISFTWSDDTTQLSLEMPRAIESGNGNFQQLVDLNGDGKAEYCRSTGFPHGSDAPESPFAGGDLLCDSFDNDTIYHLPDIGHDLDFAERPYLRSFADVNGDGRMDYCRMVGGIDKKLLCSLGGVGQFSGEISFESNHIYHYGIFQQMVDVSGDNKADFCRLVRIVQSTSLTEHRIRCDLSTGSDFSGGTWEIADVGYFDSPMYFADVNGDRRADYCRIVGQSQQRFFQCTLAQENGFSGNFEAPQSAGHPKFLTRNHCYTQMSTTDEGRTFTKVCKSNDQFMFPADINGDGKMDYCWGTHTVTHGNESQSSDSKCLLAGATGFLDAIPIENMGNEPRQFVDINGDGMSDHCRMIANALRCSFSNGKRFILTDPPYQVAIASAQLGLSDQIRQFSDVDGDGVLEYCRVVNDIPTMPHVESLKCIDVQAMEPNLLERIDNGYHGATLVEYKPVNPPPTVHPELQQRAVEQLIAQQCHIADTTTPEGYPLEGAMQKAHSMCGIRNTTPRYVVTAVKTTNNPTGISSEDLPSPVSTHDYNYIISRNEHETHLSYQYYNPRFVIGTTSEQRNLGFERITIMDEKTKNYTITRYRQDKYFEGLVSSSSSSNTAYIDPETSQPQWLNVVEYGYRKKEHYGGKTYSILNTRTLTKRHAEHTNGQIVPTYTLDNRMELEDNYGLPVEQTHCRRSDWDNGSFQCIKTYTEYAHDESQWIIGRVTSQRTESEGTVLDYQKLEYTPINSHRLTQTAQHRWLCTDATQCSTSSGSWIRTSLINYNGYGNAVNQTDVMGNMTRFEYDSQNLNLVKTINPKGFESRAAFDNFGRPSSTTDINEQATHFKYDPFGRICEQTDIEGHLTQHVYNGYYYSSQGEELSTDFICNGTVGSRIFSHIDNRHNYRGTLLHRNGDELYQAELFDGLGFVYQKQSPGPYGLLYSNYRRGHFFQFHETPSYFYPDMDSLASNPFVNNQLENILGATERTIEDVKNFLIDTYQDRSTWWDSQYDTQGRLLHTKSTTNSDGSIDSQMYYEYVPGGMEQIDAKGSKTIRYIDAWGNVVKHIDAMGQVTTYSYDAAQRLTRVALPNGTKVTISYDSWGRKKRLVDPAHGTIHYDSYDLAGRLTRQVDALGNTTTFTYDELGRPTYKKVTSPSSNTTPLETRWFYDKEGVANSKGRLDRIEDNTGTRSFTYDIAGRVKTQTWNYKDLPQTFEQTFTYDDWGNILEKTFLDPYVHLEQPTHERFVYHTDGSLAYIEINGQLIKTWFNYTALGRPSAWKTPHMHGEMHFDRLGRSEASKVWTNSNEELEFLTYRYHSAGNLYKLEDRRTSRLQHDPLGNAVDTDVSQTYFYDRLNRLSLARGPYKETNEPYDEEGEWSPRYYYYDALGKLTMQPDNFNQPELNYQEGHDAAGNRTWKTQDGVRWDYQYDAENRLKEVKRENQVVTRYRYDYKGQRTNKINYRSNGSRVMTYYITPEYSLVYDTESKESTAIRHFSGPGGRYQTQTIVDDCNSVSQLEHTEDSDAMFALASLGSKPPNDPTQKTPPSLKFPQSWQQSSSYFQTTNWNRNLLMMAALLFTLGFFYLIRQHRLELRHPERSRRALSLVPCPLNLPMRITSLSLATLIFIIACTTEEQQQKPEAVKSSIVEKETRPSTAEETDTPPSFMEPSFLPEVSKERLIGSLVDDGYRTGVWQTHRNHLSSSTFILDENGNEVSRMNYLPFGELVDERSAGENILPDKYTGQDFDEETELYYYNARYYDPKTGSFLTPDTIIPDPGDPQSYNRYSYVRNNPTNYSDPSGHFPIAAAAAVGAIMGAYSAWRAGGSTHDILVAAAIGGASGAAGAHFGALAIQAAGGISAGSAMGASFAVQGTVAGAIGGAVGGGLSAAYHGRNVLVGATNGSAYSAASGGISGSLTGTTPGFVAQPIGAYTAGYLQDGPRAGADAAAYAFGSYFVSQAVNSYLYEPQYKGQTDLENAMGKNSVVFGKRSLRHAFGFMINDPWLDKHDAELLHEELFWTDEKGRLHYRGFSPQGITSDAPLDTSNYRFSTIHRNASVQILSTKPSGFNGVDYLFFEYNCQDYCTYERRRLGL